MSYMKSIDPSFLEKLPHAREAQAAQLRSHPNKKVKEYFSGCNTLEDHLQLRQLSGPPTMLDSPEDFLLFAGIACGLRSADCTTAGNLGTTQAQQNFRAHFSACQGKAALKKMVDFIKAREPALRKYAEENGPYIFKTLNDDNSNSTTSSGTNGSANSSASGNVAVTAATTTVTTGDSAGTRTSVEVVDSEAESDLESVATTDDAPGN